MNAVRPETTEFEGYPVPAFVGLELYEGVDTEGARRAMDGLATLGVLLDVLDGLGPVERKLVTGRLKKALG